MLRISGSLAYADYIEKLNLQFLEPFRTQNGSSDITNKDTDICRLKVFEETFK